MNSRHNPTKKANKINRVITIGLIAVVIITAAFLLLRECGNQASVDMPKETPIYLEDDGGAIDGEAKAKDREEIMNELEKQQLVVTDKLSSNITFTHGEVGTVGDWMVENPKENNIILQAEVYLGDKLIAKTTPIYPNQHITGVELLADVECGEYIVTAYLNYYNIDTKEFISKAGYNIHLTVR